MRQNCRIDNVLVPLIKALTIDNFLHRSIFRHNLPRRRYRNERQQNVIVVVTSRLAGKRGPFSSAEAEIVSPEIVDKRGIMRRDSKRLQSPVSTNVGTGTCKTRGSLYPPRLLARTIFLLSASPFGFPLGSWLDNARSKIEQLAQQLEGSVSPRS